MDVSKDLHSIKDDDFAKIFFINRISSLENQLEKTKEENIKLLEIIEELNKK